MLEPLYFIFAAFVGGIIASLVISLVKKAIARLFS